MRRQHRLQLVSVFNDRGSPSWSLPAWLRGWSALAPSEKDAKLAHKSGTSAFYSCIITGMHKPTCFLRANLTPFSFLRTARAASYPSRRVAFDSRLECDILSNVYILTFARAHARHIAAPLIDDAGVWCLRARRRVARALISACIRVEDTGMRAICILPVPVAAHITRQPRLQANAVLP
jgi:hypothetical protein